MLSSRPARWVPTHYPQMAGSGWCQPYLAGRSAGRLVGHVPVVASLVREQYGRS
ncbi:hypothetical protein [Micromonospora sp. NBC_00617]|uniref:hypothetical protein n=1 Tax=Micromonospora sp. NBC_00617 TaxID=2903587 RepID=UPI0030E4F659